MLSTPLNSFAAKFENPQNWSYVKTKEFVKNTRVKAFLDGRFYLISQFPERSPSKLKRVRVLDLQNGTCSIPSSQITRIFKIVGNSLLYSLFNDFPNFSVFALNLKRMTDSKTFVEVPEWAIHSKTFTLEDGKVVKGYWNPQKAELHDDNGVFFQFNQYKSKEQLGGKGSYLEERGLILDFYVINDEINIHIYDRIGEDSEPEIPETLIYDLNGNLLTDKTAQESDLDPIYKIELDKIKALGAEIFSGVWDFPSMRISHEYRRVAFWDKWKLTISSLDQNQIMFNLPIESMRDLNSIENVFFENDLVIVLMYNKSLYQVEAVNQFRSGAGSDVNEEDRYNYNLLYFNLQGSLVKKIKLEDLKEHHDHNWSYTHDYPKIHSANNAILSKTTTFPKGYVTFYDVETKNPLGQFNIANALAKNDQYIITPEYRCINLYTGISILCQTPSPWNSVKIFGHYLAIVSPEREVTILNLETNSVVFSERTIYEPRQIVGFSYEGTDSDFIAVQFDDCIKIWYRNPAEFESA